VGRSVWPLVALSADAMRAMPRASVRAIPASDLAELSPAAATKLLNNMGADLSPRQLRILQAVASG